MTKTIEVVYENGVFRPLTPIEEKIPEGTKVAIELKGVVKERLRKYKGILKAKVSSEELDELYYHYVAERTDIP
jgi:predicted DNA-binding antitoxin AbrB/MazE fold protein